MHKKLKEGFTLVELSLSIVFISILSITMALMINEAISTYRRGITLNRLNTTGMEMVDDMRAAVQNSSARAVEDDCASLYGNQTNARTACENNKGYGLISVTKKAKVVINGRESVNDTPVLGAFCTGEYSYIWNSGYFFNEGEYKVEGASRASLSYNTESGTRTARDFRLLKVEDVARRVCMAATVVKNNSDEAVDYRVDYKNFDGNFDISKYETLSEEPVMVLENGDANNLALYGLDVAYPATSDAKRDIFYAVSFVLGTLQGGINVKASGNFCATPEGYEAAENFDYCAINKFNFAAQAIGG